MNFRDLGLIDPILKALELQGYTEPTPIQQGAIPPALTGRDVLGCAQTGTGKTCAFATPILQRLNGRIPQPRVIRALILTPTRELAIQIQDSFEAYGKYLPLRHAVIFGGVGQQPQVDQINRGLDILVATPGRLLDLHGQGLLDLSHIEIFVLDEADRMLDMGFIHDVRRVIRLLPEKKQTLFFSATMPPEVMDLVNSLLHDYQRVEVDPVSSPVEVIQQSLYYVDKANKTKLLAHLLEEQKIPSALVFSRTKHGANRIAQDLNKRGISAAAIHGNKSQTARVQALTDFKEGRVRALVATDIAARGLDIEELGWVVNYDLPEVAETYVHRIGRTGRAGRGGSAISFCREDEKEYLKGIEKLLRRSIPVVEDHPYPMGGAPAPAAPRALAAQEAQPQEEGRSRRRRRKKKSGSQGGEAPQAAPAAAPAPQIPEKQPRRRGERLGDLEATLPQTPQTPSGDFYRPNPLDSDVIMDATARLLSSRKPLPAFVTGGRHPAQPESAGEGSGRSRRRKKKKGGEESGRAAQAIQSRQESQPRTREQPEQPPAGSGSGRKRRRRGRHGGPRPVEPPRRDHLKDSTEHESLMKPYYLHQDD